MHFIGNNINSENSNNVTDRAVNMNYNAVDETVLITFRFMITIIRIQNNRGQLT